MNELLDERDVLRYLTEAGAIIEGHFVYASGLHGDKYIAKDAVYPHTRETYRLCRGIALAFKDEEIDTVIGPVTGGVIVSFLVARILTKLTGKNIMGVFADRKERSILKATMPMSVGIIASGAGTENLPAVQTDAGRVVTRQLVEKSELLIRDPGVVIKRGYARHIEGKKVLAVEDILNTGGTALTLIEETRAKGGRVVGLGAFCNRGGVTAVSLGDIPRLYALLNLSLPAWDEKACWLCQTGAPVNLEYGKGREFMTRKGL